MGREKAGLGDFIRKIVSLVVLVAAVVALIFFFMGAGSTFIEPFKIAFENGFNFNLFSFAVYGAIANLSVPLTLGLLGLIGLTVDK